jgi:metallophosphoesterase (TIGR00282 family)
VIVLKVLFIGDIVGSVGREALRLNLKQLKDKFMPDFVVVNGENAAAGRGITEAIAKDFYAIGVDGITMGNHTWDNKNIFTFIDDDNRLVRPANFPQGAPGKGYTVLKKGNKKLAIMNMQGRTFLPAINCPFRTADTLLDELKGITNQILFDFHAEATSEKIAMGWHLDGRVSAVVGTHTHVQTNDARILPNGTAYITDVGMCGPVDGVLGMEKEAVLYKFLTQLPARFTVDEGKWQFHAVLINLDNETGKAQSIQQIRSLEDNFIFE